MEAKFSPRVKDVINFSREEALRLGHDYIGTEHLLLGMIREGDGSAIKILKALKVDLMELRKSIENSTKPASKKNVAAGGNIPLVKQAEKALKITYLEAKLFNSNIIGTEHLLLSILKDDDNVATRALESFNINYEIVKNELDNMKSEPRADFPGNASDDDEKEESASFGQSTKKPIPNLKPLF
jgi:ATP-dependent Clp protease ATP-binding subunit ClpC